MNGYVILPSLSWLILVSVAFVALVMVESYRQLSLPDKKACKETLKAWQRTAITFCGRYITWDTMTSVVALVTNVLALIWFPYKGLSFDVWFIVVMTFTAGGLMIFLVYLMIFQETWLSVCGLTTVIPVTYLAASICIQQGLIPAIILVAASNINVLIVRFTVSLED